MSATWSVTYETSTIQAGIAPTKEEAERIAVNVHDSYVVKGLSPDALAWHVEARCLHLNREHVGPGHRDRCNDCGATSYVRSRDARIEWETGR
jgi:hypothetical protein